MALAGAAGSWWLQSKLHEADKVADVNVARAEERASVKIVNAGGARLQRKVDELTARAAILRGKLDAELKKKPVDCPVPVAVVELLNESARAPDDSGPSAKSGPQPGTVDADTVACEEIIRTSVHNNGVALRNAELARELRRTYNEVKDKYNGAR